MLDRDSSAPYNAFYLDVETCLCRNGSVQAGKFGMTFFLMLYRYQLRRESHPQI